ncbi:redoxin domain-containing protein, partial [Pseudomonas agarici]
GPVVIVFLRGLWCWYSYTTLIALETIHTALSDRGVSVIAISPQLHFSQVDVDRKQAFNFPLLCDSRSRIAQEFQVAWRLSVSLKKTYLQLGADLDKLNGADCELLPMTSFYIIDRQGTIVYSDVNPNYVQLMSMNEILLVLDNMPQPRKSRAIE